jgi:hypothetical protein
MRKLMVVFLMMVLLSVSAMAQQYIFKGTSSAGVINDSITFNCDFISPVSLPGAGMVMHYKGQGQSAFGEIPMPLIQGDPYYATTRQNKLQFSSNQGNMQYYFSVGTDTLMLTQSPFWSGSQWPSAEYFADFAADPIGDTMSGSGNASLDLTGSGMTYSNTKVYSYLSNATGTWPANQGTSLNLYALGLVDPANLSGTVYAMVYINIYVGPIPILTPGLYKIDITDTSFTRIGNVDYSISGGKLYMSCNISDLVSDSGWTSWPPSSGYVITSGVTFKGSLTSPALADYTMPTFYEPGTQFLNFNNNSAPSLFDISFEEIYPISLTARIKYYDPDSNLPSIRRLYFDGSMLNMGSFDHVYSDTAVFEHVLAWPDGNWHYYYFVFSDGQDTISTPLDSVRTEQIGIENEGQIPGAFALNQNYPNPFNGSTDISFEIKQMGLVTLSIYDIAGRQVDMLVNGIMQAGKYSLNWQGDGKDNRGLPSGVYFYRLSSGSDSQCRKMIYLK